MEVKVDIDEVLVTPDDIQPILLVIVSHHRRPIGGSHSRQVHQHHARVETCQSNNSSAVNQRRRIRSIYLGTLVPSARQYSHLDLVTSTVCMNIGGSVEKILNYNLDGPRRFLAR